MGKHDQMSHTLHIPKGLKFKQQKPSTPAATQKQAPQFPKQGRSSHNMYK